VQLPEELPLSDRYWEGTVARVIVNKFERDRGAREECLRQLGRQCVVCEMSFGQRYGLAMEGLIHVHHLVPLSEIREGYTPDPARDLVPICPNCHAVIHARGTTRTVEEVRRMVMRGGGTG
jgi:5-methylcytosine-specific restriction protein A